MAHAMHGSWHKVGVQLGVPFLPLTWISGMAVPDVPRCSVRRGWRSHLEPATISEMGTAGLTVEEEMKPCMAHMCSSNCKEATCGQLKAWMGEKDGASEK